MPSIDEQESTTIKSPDIPVSWQAMPEEDILDQISRLNNELVNAHRELVKKNREIATQKERFRQIIEHISDSLVIIDQDMKVLFMNGPCKSMLGSEERDFTGMDICDLLTLKYPHSNDRFDIAGSCDPVKNDNSFQADMVLLREHGNELHVEISLSKISTYSNFGSDMLLVMHDIDQRKKLEYRQAEINDFLRVINSILRHDISNNLTIMGMSVDLMKTPGNEEIAAKALKCIDKCTSLITRMQDLESALFKDYTLRPFNVRDVVSSVIENYDIGFNVEGKATVMADGALYSVFDNIINNSIVHGHTELIEVVIVKTGDFCRIEIKDHGTGIPSSIMGKVFEEEFKYGSSAHTGLGLHIVKKVIERYGGEVHITANKPAGTVLILKLPLSDP
ncbi:ATP-binding protein [Methanolobus sp. WCC5]|uniref:ATP-binding protein n=1 Tax=Methanolobus sp. WCC5 TaxID=3125785 RepID=UPI0032524061